MANIWWRPPGTDRDNRSRAMDKLYAASHYYEQSVPPALHGAPSTRTAGGFRNGRQRGRRRPVADAPPVDNVTGQQEMVEVEVTETFEIPVDQVQEAVDEGAVVIDDLPTNG